MASHSDFFARNARSFPTGVYLDDDDSDKIALIVVDEMPIDTINKILGQNEENIGARYIELADTYLDIADWEHEYREGTQPNVKATWKSPFIGHSLQQVAAWIRQTPKPPKPISKTYFAVLQRALYDQENKVLICRRFDNDYVETIPMDARKFGAFLVSFRREQWR